MTKIESLIEEARGLPPSEQRRLLAELKRSLESEDGPDKWGRSYASLLSLAGTAPSDFGDVSAEKYDHAAEAYSPKTPTGE